MAILLPHVMAYNADKCAAAYGELLSVLTDAETYAATPADDRAQKAVRTVAALLSELHELSGLPVKLSETGRVGKTDFDAVAEKALNDGALLFNPKGMTKNDVVEILNKAF